MKELLEFLAKSLVDSPDEVVVTEAGEKDGATRYEVTVAESDKGRIIGKEGRIAKSIRTIVKSAAARDGKRIIVDIM